MDLRFSIEGCSRGIHVDLSCKIPVGCENQLHFSPIGNTSQAESLTRSFLDYQISGARRALIRVSIWETHVVGETCEGRVGHVWMRVIGSCRRGFPALHRMCVIEGVIAYWSERLHRDMSKIAAPTREYWYTHSLPFLSFIKGFEEARSALGFDWKANPGCGTLHPWISFEHGTSPPPWINAGCKTFPLDQHKNRALPMPERIRFGFTLQTSIMRRTWGMTCVLKRRFAPLSIPGSEGAALRNTLSLCIERRPSCTESQKPSFPKLHFASKVPQKLFK